MCNRLLASTSLAVVIAVSLCERLYTLFALVHCRFDLTAAFMDGGNPYLTSPAADGAYVFYVTAIMPGLNNGQNLPYEHGLLALSLRPLTMVVLFCSMCQFADGMVGSTPSPRLLPPSRLDVGDLSV